MQRELKVLIADDSEDDRFFLERALKNVTTLRVVSFVEDGAEAIAYLKGDGKYADRSRYPVPEVLVLDLKMPRKNGFEVLEWMKDAGMAAVKVAVMSGSTMETDRDRALSLGAATYIVKSCAGIGYSDAARALAELSQQAAA